MFILGFVLGAIIGAGICYLVMRSQVPTPPSVQESFRPYNTRLQKKPSQKRGL